MPIELKFRMKTPYDIRMYKVMGDASKTKKSSIDRIGITKNEILHFGIHIVEIT